MKTVALALLALSLPAFAASQKDEVTKPLKTVVNSVRYGKDLAALKPLVNLQVLNLSENAIDNMGLASLSGLADLDTLSLENTKVTGEGLKLLASLTKLRVLNLNHCNIVGADLEHLVVFRDLKMLFVRGIRLSKAVVEAFKDKMNNVAVFDYVDTGPPAVFEK